MHHAAAAAAIATATLQSTYIKRKIVCDGGICYGDAGSNQVQLSCNEMIVIILNSFRLSVCVVNSPLPVCAKIAITVMKSSRTGAPPLNGLPCARMMLIK